MEYFSNDYILISNDGFTIEPRLLNKTLGDYLIESCQYHKKSRFIY